MSFALPHGWNAGGQYFFRVGPRMHGRSRLTKALPCAGSSRSLPSVSSADAPGTTARAPRNIPIVSQRPSISKRLEAQRQHQNEVEIIGRTEVQGSLIR